LLINASSYLDFIKLETSILHLSIEIRINLFDSPPVFVSDEISLSLLTSLVDDLRSPLVAAFKSTYKAVSMETHSVFYNTIYVIANVNTPFHYEVHCVYVVKFIVDYLPFLVLDRLQKFEKIDHKLTINKAIPVQIRMLMFALKVFELKKHSELVDKSAEQKVFVDTILYLLGELLQNIMISFRLDGNIAIIIPLVVKIFLHISFVVLSKRISLIEVMKKSKKL
jgi:hypothetical protein